MPPAPETPVTPTISAPGAKSPSKGPLKGAPPPSPPLPAKDYRGGVHELSKVVMTDWMNQLQESAKTGSPSAYLMISGNCVEILRCFDILPVFPEINALQLAIRKKALPYMHTGDLGEFTKSGLRIFGRKDGAFKLTTGEMVLPPRVESVLVNESPFIGTAVVVGSGRDYVGALLFPDFARLRHWAVEHGIPENGPLTEHPAVRAHFAAELERLNPLIEPRYQRVQRAVLADREPSLERGELTPSSKIVRKVVLDAFKKPVESMFEPTPSEGDGVIEVRDGRLQGVAKP